MRAFSCHKGNHGTAASMARISEEDIARVREATDLVGLVAERVVLKRKGRLYWACCPFHQEKTPSFKVDPATGLWHCFGCGEGGDVFGFLMRTDNLTFVEAVTTLADRANIEIKALEEGGVTRGERDRVFAVCRESAAYYHAVLTRSPAAQPKAAREYLTARGFDSDVAKRWSLGYALGRGSLVAQLRERGHKDEDMIKANVALATESGILRDRFYERIMFPINDLQGRCCAFGGRLLGEGQPKYLNTNDTPVFHKSNTLYGLDRAKNAIVKSKTAIVVEGYTDVIALHGAGHTNAVATLGTALTDRHVKLLSRFAQRVVYVFDGDEAGLRAADRAVEFIDETITPEATKNPVMLDVVVLPSGLDPADLVATADGQAQFAALIADATPLITFALRRRLAQYDLARPEQQIRALEDAVAILAPIKTSSIAASYARDLADMFATAGSNIDPAQVMTALGRAKPLPRRDMARDEDGKKESVVTHVEPEPFDPLEVEALGLMIANPSQRTKMCTIIEPEMFGSALLRDLYAVVIDADPARPSAEIVKELTDSDSRIPAIFSRYDFDEGASALPEVGRQYAKSLATTYWEREIRALKAQVRGATDPETAKRIVAEIVELQNKILALP